MVCLSTDKAAYPINAMGISKAMMEHVITANARVAAEQGDTVICCTRYGNVMCSRGSVIPLFIDQIKSGNPITITNPDMTRFLMNLDEAVTLVQFAFEHAMPGDLFIQKSDASTIGVLAKAVQKLFGDTGTRIIGTRHGEKLCETLMTREERLRSEDMGNYFRVSADNRDLNYDKYFTKGKVATQADESYTSHNTRQLNVEETVEKILTEKHEDIPTVVGVQANGKTIECKAIVSNANLKATILSLLEPNAIDEAFRKETKAVRLNNSSCQVYMGFKEGETLPNIGDLIFTSDEECFSSASLKAFNTQSRTFSVYYPSIRPESPTPRYTIVASTNALWDDWANLSEEDYKAAKETVTQRTLAALERFVPHATDKIAWIEVATPKTFQRYTQHWEGASFGTKFEGLKVSMELPQHVHGLYHAGSVGIIMSGWLGTVNYGVITADKVDQYLRSHA